ncbi:MAG TPA: redoxin domain-containing protein [Candidatus Binatia bacterium]|jgi:peroxiredoxin
MIEQDSDGSRDTGGNWLRPGPILWIALFGLLAFVAFGFLGQVFFQAQRAAPLSRPDFAAKLAIEKSEKVIPAPDFTLEDISGKRVRLHDLKGKAVFLNFWATWCVPCRQEMPLMQKLHEEFKDRGLEIVAVNFRESKPEVEKFFAEFGLKFTSLLDSDGAVSEQYGAWSLPLTYFINRRGEFVGKAIGERRWESAEAKAFFTELLRQNN